MKKKFLGCFAFLFACVSVVLFAAGCGAQEKEFSHESGVSVTLTTDFEEYQASGFDYALTSSSVMFIAKKETFDVIESAGYDTNMSLNDYAELCVTNNLLSSTVEVDEESGLTYFVYNKSVQGDKYSYVAFVFKGTDAFWLCQFACLEQSYDNQESKIFDWATTIEVA